MSHNDPPPPYNPDNFPPPEKGGIPPLVGYSNPTGGGLSGYSTPGGPPPPAGSYPPPAGSYPPPAGSYPPPPPTNYPPPGPGNYPPPPTGMGYPSQPPPGYGQPVYPAYQPGNQPNQTVIVTQPTSVTTTTVLGGFREAPSNTTCPHCHAQVITNIYYESGTFTILLCAIICLVGCDFGCCLIPFCVDGCKDVVHRCPHCMQQISRWNRM